MITNIRDIEKFRRAAWDWTPFNNCFRGIDGEATGIRISDIDGHVERKGHFLWFETTSKDTITRGQMLSIRHRVIRGDTAIIIMGKPNEPTRMHVYYPHSEAPVRYQSVTTAIIWRIARKWFLWADANGIGDDSQDLVDPDFP